MKRSLRDLSEESPSSKKMLAKRDSTISEQATTIGEHVEVAVLTTENAKLKITNATVATQHDKIGSHLRRQ